MHPSNHFSRAALQLAKHVLELQNELDSARIELDSARAELDALKYEADARKAYEAFFSTGAAIFAPWESLALVYRGPWIAVAKALAT